MYRIVVVITLQYVTFFLTRTVFHVTYGGCNCILFEPNIDELERRCLLAPETFTSVDDNNGIVLVLENHGCEPVYLEAGQVLGWVCNAVMCPGWENSVDCIDSGVKNGSIMTVPMSSVNTLIMGAGVNKGEEQQQTLEGDPRVLKLLNKLMISESNLTEEQLTLLRSLVAEYSDIFALDMSELGVTDIVSHTVDTGSSPPIQQPVRRTPFALCEKMEELIQDMMAQGVIKQSSSPWASPVVLVEKRDGSHRFCVDYRCLNAVTKMDVFPLPRVDDTLDMLSQTQYFSTLDLTAGYWQVRMDKDSQEKTAFSTYSRHYEFQVMPFGLSNAPATFSRLMETVLVGLNRSCCLVYLDDVLVIGKSFSEHLLNLRKVFERFHEANLKLKPEKCCLASDEVLYLGYVVSRNGILADPIKAESVKNFPQPNDLKSLQSFLGLASYYRRFIQKFSRVAGPLYELTRKDVEFLWKPIHDEVFCQLKQLLINAPVLAFPDFTKGFILETDASGVGLCAILAQGDKDGIIHPIAYASRALQQYEKNYAVTELEALGIVWAIKHFHHYLYGHHSEVYTDHEPLIALLNTPHPSGKLARRGLILQDVDLVIRYRPGRKNAGADALSRLPVNKEDGVNFTPVEKIEDLVSSKLLVAATTVEDNAKSRERSGEGSSIEGPCDYQQSGENNSSPQQAVEKGSENLKIRKRQLDDPELKCIMLYLEDGELPRDEKKAKELVLGTSLYEVVDGILYHVELDKSLRLIPPTCDRESLFQEVLSGTFGAHLKDTKIYGELSKHYWWPRMRSDIWKWCRSCLVCATRQPGRVVQLPLTSIPISGLFHRVGVDVIQFTKSHSGNRYAVVFVDYLTKWPEVFATPDQTALTIAKLFVEQIISRHGVPVQLLSDRGAAFLSYLLAEICKLMGVEKLNTMTYHPQMDGLAERLIEL